MFRAILLVTALAAAGCTPITVQTGGAPSPQPSQQPAKRAVTNSDVQRAARSFEAVAARVEPVAESTCRQVNPRVTCDFAIVVDTNMKAAPNAYQTVKNGRPVILFTMPLIVDARNSDELAFIMGHEAAHHIRNHIPQTQATATAGAAVGAILAAALGADGAVVDTAQQLGGYVGARQFSKGYELEADSLGAQIAKRAGYDPIRGAQYFTRIPDPGNRFLGSHPPNADRIATVKRAVGG
ncbi:M48 family metallopeptidase [Halovulum sp. GXIMD14794]